VRERGAIASKINPLYFFISYYHLQNMSDEDKSVVLRFLDLTIRDYKSKHV